MKKSDVILLVSLFFVLLLTFVLMVNKTFFRSYYVDSNDNKIFVPRFSFLVSNDDDFIVLYSLRVEDDLDSSIEKFLSDCNDSSCKYDYDAKYTVENGFLFRKIIIEY